MRASATTKKEMAAELYMGSIGTAIHVYVLIRNNRHMLLLLLSTNYQNYKCVCVGGGGCKC